MKQFCLSNLEHVRCMNNETKMLTKQVDVKKKCAEEGITQVQL